MDLAPAFSKRGNNVAWIVGLAACALMGNAAMSDDQAGDKSPDDTGVPKIVQSRGVDQSVDYRSLTKYGPWDDRNYKLTAQDLEYLAPDEQELRDPLPAFFRVELRKEMPHLRRSGPAQYPRSAVQLFENRYGGLQQEFEVRDDAESPPRKRCSKGQASLK